MRAEHPWYWSWRGWRGFHLARPLLVGGDVASDRLRGCERRVPHRCRRRLRDRRVGARDRHRGARPVPGRKSPRPDGASRWHARRAGRGGADGVPFAAAVVLFCLIALPLASAWNAQPSDVEAAVEREWQGRQLTVPLGFGVGGSDPDTATAPVSAKDVSCEGTAADVDGAPVYACTVVHCDVDRASFIDCPDTTSPACAALSGNELVLISSTWGRGRAACATSCSVFRSARSERGGPVARRWNRRGRCVTISTLA